MRPRTSHQRASCRVTVGIGRDYEGMVATSHDAFAYTTLFAALAVAVGTLMAVVVALFGPQWQRRRRRPRLSVEVDGLTEAIILHHRDSGDLQLATLRVENARGNDRAEDVEVYVDIGWEFEPTALLPLVEQEPLPYGDPRTLPPPPRSRSVAAGFASRTSAASSRR